MNVKTLLFHKFKIYFLAVFFLIISCKQGINSERELYKYISQPENGLLVIKSTNNVVITVKYLPGAYLTAKEIKNAPNISKSAIDSILNSYKNTYAFLLTLQLDTLEKVSGDLFYMNLSGYGDYKARVLDLNFNLHKYIYLKTKEREYSPVLTNMENSYSTVNKVTFSIIFSDDDEANFLIKADKLDFVFNDETFGTGINHFTFYKRDIDKIPFPAFLYTDSKF